VPWKSLNYMFTQNDDGVTYDSCLLPIAGSTNLIHCVGGGQYCVVASATDMTCKPL
jgi:hypothetical protein